MTRDDPWREPWWFDEPRRRRPRWLRNAVATPWRWRWEWGVPAGVWSLGEATHPAVAGGVVAAGVAGGLLVGPGTRRWVQARVVALVVQHRLRVGMVHCRLVSSTGRLPAILRTRVVDRGIRVTLWLPAGLDADDFRTKRRRLAAACWSAKVEVRRRPGHAHVVDVLIVRPRYRRWTIEHDPS